MKFEISNTYLYLLSVAGSLAVVLFASGELLWGTSNDAGPHWTEHMFYGICHRIPDRTYGFENAFMAVNTRCFGVFAGNFAGWLFLPLFSKITVGKRWPIFLLLLSVLLQAADVAGNMAGLWENTNHSRALLGCLLGFAIPLSVSDLFYLNPNKTSI
ncbi:MAG: DUF2085 domain-containing protein [Bacteroidetes bacterium]|jgi:uncharacterized membrane protein|nr:DUF2085 domain-containing protein [Bacteroidota bacterium]